MSDSVSKLLRQQTAIANFGSFALQESDLQAILTEAARVCAHGLNVPFSKVCRYRQEENDLLVEAGFGWHEDVVGHVVSRADRSSPQGRAFLTGEPAICRDLREDTQFELPAFYAEHGIRSTIDVIIKGDPKPYGVLEVDDDQPRDSDTHDIDFLTSFANVLAEAVKTSTRAVGQSETIDRMKELMEEKDRLLTQKNVLADELQHRVRNNLQLLSGMVASQLRDTVDTEGKKGLKAISRRISALGEVYEHLLGREMARSMDFGGYLTSLCRNLEEIYRSEDVTMCWDCDSVTMDLNDVTALGIIVTEIVANAYDHAFDGGAGAAIVVTLRAPSEPEGRATIAIRDNGRGFEPVADSKRRGLGLVRRLVEQVGGTATLEPGSGTAWTVKFPVSALQSPAARERELMSS
jgi:two-component sensor histidine kinase